MKRMQKHMLLAVVALAMMSAAARAVEPDEILKDPVQEARAREITRELRCVVCQNQSVDDSDAPLAKDIRVLVRERIAAGETNEAVKDFIVQRYGQYVLLRPPFGVDTALIWIGPFALFAIALGLALAFLRRGRGDTLQPQPLTPEEEIRLDARLQDDRT